MSNRRERSRNGLRAAILVASLVAGGCVRAQDAAVPLPRETVVGLPCEGCEAVFEGLPREVPAAVRLAGADEPGESLRIEGIVFDAEGRPASGIVVYAYHTDAQGHYPPPAHSFGRESARHGRLRGWAASDETGHYRFDTIRPAGYPGTTIPQHVHMHVIEPGRCTYYIDDILFADDPRLTTRAREDLVQGRGGPGVATPQRDEAGLWHVERDIHLGANIPGYPE